MSIDLIKLYIKFPKIPFISKENFTIIIKYDIIYMYGTLCYIEKKKGLYQYECSTLGSQLERHDAWSRIKSPVRDRTFHSRWPHWALPKELGRSYCQDWRWLERPDSALQGPLEWCFPWWFDTCAVFLHQRYSKQASEGKNLRAAPLCRCNTRGYSAGIVLISADPFVLGVPPTLTGWRDSCNLFICFFHLWFLFYKQLIVFLNLLFEVLIPFLCRCLLSFFFQLFLQFAFRNVNRFHL